MPGRFFLKERSMSSSPSGPSGALVLLLVALTLECINFIVALPDGIWSAIVQAVLAGILAIAAFAVWHVIASLPTKNPKCI